MPKKRNLKSRLIDFTIILICFAGSFIAVRAFWLEYNRAYTKLNESPVGTITFKKRTAQRKIIDRAAWDLLKQSSGVYNGDTIRTAEGSEAVITFRDNNTRIAINANTLIQIFYNDTDGARIDFSEGNIEVDSGTAGGATGRSVTVTQGLSEIKVMGQAAIDIKDEGLSVFVLEGEAVLDGDVIETGNMLILDERGERDDKPAIAVYSLSSSARIRGTQGGQTPVAFEWKEYNFNPDTFVIIEISLDPFFKHITQSAVVNDSSNASIYMDIGEYFWRAYPANAGTNEPANPIYPSGSLEIFAFQDIPVFEAVHAAALEAAGSELETEHETAEAVSASVTPTVTPQTTTAVTPAHTPAPAANPVIISSAEVNQVFYNKNNWIVFLQGQSASIRNRVTLDYHTGKEFINGQEKEVLTITVDLPRSGSEWRQGLIDITDDIILQKLKSAEGFRFKMTGDGGRGWQILVQTSSVRDNGFHEFDIPAAGDQAVEVNIPFSALKQPIWANNVRFNRNNITVLQIRRYADSNRNYSGSSTIKIFDFEIY